jgi:hypothetical protein
MMLIILRASILIAAFFFAAHVNADQVAPADTATFVSYCTDATFNICRLEVVRVNNTALINQLSKRHGCTFPRAPHSNTKAASIPATKAILGWLRANGSTRALKTHDAIAQAIATLWPNQCEN